MPFVVLLIGLLLILFEFFSSGGLFATLGAAAVVSSVIWTGYYTGSTLPTVVFTLLAGLLSYLVVRFGMRQVRSHMRLDADQEGTRAAPLDEKLVGKSGAALTDLRPGGRVEIEGAPYPAVSQKGYIAKGSKIEIIQVQMGHLIVR
jgi:membrane-bound serine protease (ClpP class)